MPQPIKAFQCQFHGGRAYVTKRACTKHEAICFKNPVRRACQTCKHNEWTDHYIGSGAIDDPNEYNGYSCNLGLTEDNQPVSDCEKWEEEDSEQQTVF